MLATIITLVPVIMTYCLWDFNKMIVIIHSLELRKSIFPLFINGAPRRGRFSYKIVSIFQKFNNKLIITLIIENQTR